MMCYGVCIVMVIQTKYVYVKHIRCAPKHTHKRINSSHWKQKQQQQISHKINEQTEKQKKKKECRGGEEGGTGKSPNCLENLYIHIILRVNT